MLAGVFWSLGGILVRNVESANEWQILFVRSLAAAATFLCVLWWRYRLEVFGAFEKAGRAAVFGGLCLSLGFTGFVFAMVNTSIANAVFILSASPLGAALLAWLFLKEQVSRVTWAAAAFAMIGIGVMVAGGVAAGTLFGNLMALLAMAGFCGYATALRAGRGGDMLPAACLAGVFAGLFAGVMVADLDLTAHDFAVCVAMGVLQIGAGLTVFTLGSKSVPAAELALLSLTEVILAPLWVWIGIGEVPTGTTLLGGGIVFAALAWRALLGLRRKPPPFGAV
jgi:drug/metabolite transporter (DMT)-like permease